MGLARFFHTLRHLRFEQFFYRCYFRFFRFLVHHKALRNLNGLVRNAWKHDWVAPCFSVRSHLSHGVFEFLGERGEVRVAEDWNSSTKTKLWLYNLHYFDDLNAQGSGARSELHEWLIDRWIADNPPFEGNGWEPYPIALRIVNWVKWFSRVDHLDPKWVASLARQAEALFVQEERHLLANHLFVDAKALVFAGAFFSGADGNRWLSRGLKILDEEIFEQFLPDGGNFELSPMYHASLLWDVCDLVRLAELSGVPDLDKRVDTWKGVIERGIRWMEAMCHPDKGVSFFNDSAFGIAPTLFQLVDYASLVGCDLKDRSTSGLSLQHFSDTGYVVIDWEAGGRAILDVAKVGPDYQPGHAHADTLSFELSLFGQRVLVNSGTSQYGEDAERQRQRGTSAHNTVIIDDEDSSEVWAGFRVARRATPFDLDINCEKSELKVCCSHNGYQRLSGAPTHRRMWKASPNKLRVSDSITGRFKSAVSRLHLHPDIQVTADGELLLKDGQCVRFEVTGGTWCLKPTTWHPGFGVSVENKCIEINFIGDKVVTEFTWN